MKTTTAIRLTFTGMAAMMITLGFLIPPSVADTTFRITQKIYGYHKIGDAPPVTTAPAADQAQPVPVQPPQSSPPAAAETAPSLSPPAAEQVQKLVQPQPSVAPSVEAQSKSIEPLKKKHEKTLVKKEPKPTPAKTIEKTVTEKPAVEQAQTSVQPQPLTEAPLKKKHEKMLVKKEPKPTPAKTIEKTVTEKPVSEPAAVTTTEATPPQPLSEEPVVKRVPQTTVEQIHIGKPPVSSEGVSGETVSPKTASPEITPKTQPVDVDHQPLHHPTVAEQAEALKSAKNEALFKEALTHYNDAIRLNQQGRFKEAVVEYQKALFIDPAMPDARVGLAVAYASLGQWQPMINELEMAVQFKDMFLDKFNLVQAHYNLGAAYCVQQDARRAHQELQLVREASHPNIKQLEMFIDSHCASQ